MGGENHLPIGTYSGAPTIGTKEMTCHVLRARISAVKARLPAFNGGTYATRACICLTSGRWTGASVGYENGRARSGNATLPHGDTVSMPHATTQRCAASDRYLVRTPACRFKRACPRRIARPT